MLAHLWKNELNEDMPYGIYEDPLGMFIEPEEFFEYVMKSIEDRTFTVDLLKQISMQHACILSNLTDEESINKFVSTTSDRMSRILISLFRHHHSIFVFPPELLMTPTDSMKVLIDLIDIGNEGMFQEISTRVNLTLTQYTQLAVHYIKTIHKKPPEYIISKLIKRDNLNELY